MLADLLDNQTEIPDSLKTAMAYMLQNGGKRIRGAMVMWCCNAVAGRITPAAMVAAAAIEMVHTYSLIHDDLPAMDDDDMRRGQPSCHRKFDEATAILAGDALLTLAFEVLSVEVDKPELAIRLVRTLAEAAGPSGMIAGQVADMAGDHKIGTMDDLRYIHINKTAKMFAAAAGLGAIAGEANEKQLEQLIEYGLKIGLGFQVSDDILDVVSTAEQLGKTIGKDQQQGKLTYPALVGLEKSKEIAEFLTEEAVMALEGLDNEADILRRLAVEMLYRTK